MNGSGVIAQVEVVDDGAELTVSGHAYNLDPAGTYLSLFYGIGSFPGGPNACFPAPDPANLLTAGEMFVGF